MHFMTGMFYILCYFVSGCIDCVISIVMLLLSFEFSHRTKLEELAVSVAANKAAEGVKRRFDAT